MAHDSVARSQIISQAAEQLGRPRGDVAEVVVAVLDVMTRMLAEGRRVNLRGFGTFDPRVKGPVLRHRPDTMEKVVQPTHVRLAFKPSPTLKTHLNGRLTPRS